MKYLLFITLLGSGILRAQQEVPSFTIHRAAGTIRIDGVVDEQDWIKAEVISELIQQFPYDTSRSLLRTEFRATYDDEFIYFSAVA